MACLASDHWGHISTFLEGCEVQALAQTSQVCAMGVRSLYRNLEQRKRIWDWNQFTKRFCLVPIGTSTWLELNLSEFDYLNHLDYLRHVVWTQPVRNLTIQSEPPHRISLDHLVQLIVMLMHPSSLESVSLQGLDITDKEYKACKSLFGPKMFYPHRALYYISFRGGRVIHLT